MHLETLLRNKGRFCNTIASLSLTPQFKAISEYRQKKFSQPVIQNKHGRQSCPETSSANSPFVRAKGGF